MRHGKAKRCGNPKKDRAVAFWCSSVEASGYRGTPVLGRGTEKQGFSMHRPEAVLQRGQLARGFAALALNAVRQVHCLCGKDESL